MSFKLTLKSLLSETRKMVKLGQQKIDYFKEEKYRLVSQSYTKLNQNERYEYLRELSLMHDYNREKLYNLKAQDTTSDALRVRRMYSIKESLQPKYREFFINLGRVPDGIKLLVDLRTDVIDIQRLISNQILLSLPNDIDPNQSQNISTSFETIKFTNDTTLFKDNSNLRELLNDFSTPENSSNLFVLNAELKDLINVWFAGGFCQLQRITWNSSCQLLQRISELEAVHPVKGWADIKRRVGAYRRCYVFTHPCMPNEPVVILHTALLPEIPASIKEVVQRHISKSIVNEEEIEDPKRIDAAIFYSISSPHSGLTGIDLGNTLIKRVVQTLHFEFPTLNQFSTLSPVPGFRKWLDAEIQNCLLREINCRVIEDKIDESSYVCRLFSPSELKVLSEYFHTSTVKDLLSRLEMKLEGISSNFNSTKDLMDISDENSSDYKMLSWLLKSLTVKYLCGEKHRGYALDSVCNFHLKNGATIWRINWLADSSPRGIQNSYGVMVNYRYYNEKTEINSRKYIENKTLEVSNDVQQIIDGIEPNFQP